MLHTENRLPSRRRWLALAGGALTACGTAPAPEPMPESNSLAGRIIDSHVHVWTPDTAAYPLADGFSPERMAPPSFTPEQLFALSKPSGVERINLIQMSFYGDDHRYMIEAMRTYPENFSGTGLLTGVGETETRPVERMLELAADGMKAFRLSGSALRGDDIARWMEHPHYDELYSAAAEHSLALSFLIDPADLKEIDRMGKRFPDTPVIIDHLARIHPDHSRADAQIESLCRLAHHPKTMVKIGAFYALSPAGPPYVDLLPLIKQVVEAFGPERCMWETDCPFQVNPPHTYDASVALICDHADFLSASDKEHILVGTAERFFFSG